MNPRGFIKISFPYICDAQKEFPGQLVDAVDRISLTALRMLGSGLAWIVYIPANGPLICVPKLHHVLPIADTWWIPAAVLNPDYPQLRTGNLTGIRVRNQTHEDIHALVKRVVRYVQINGKEKTFVEINKPDGIFVNGSFSVWALSFDGTLL